MTIASDDPRKAGPYDCNGVTVTFPFSFKIFAAATDLLVTLADSNGVETTLAYSTDYSVSMNADQNANPGGSITTVSTYATGYTVTVESDVPATQNTSIPSPSAFSPTVIEAALDRAVALVLDLRTKLDRTLRGPRSDDDVLIDLPVAAERASRYFAFDVSGQPMASAGGPGAVAISSAMEVVVGSATLALARAALGVASETLLARGIAGGRLSPSSVSTAGSYSHRPVTNAVVYYVPFTGRLLGLYDSGTWKLATIDGTSGLSLAALTDDRPFDVFAYYNAGVVALEGVSWSSDSARATSLNSQNDVVVKSGDSTRRYLGTGRKRGGLVSTVAPNLELWNMYNRIPVSTYVGDTTNTWTIATSSTWRQVRASAANQINFVTGFTFGVHIEAHAYARALNSGATSRFVATGIGLNSVTFNSATVTRGANCTSTLYGYPDAHFVGHDTNVALGQNYLAWLERGDGSDTQTFSGDEGLTADNMSNGLFAVISM